MQRAREERELSIEEVEFFRDNQGEVIELLGFISTSDRVTITHQF